MTLCWKNAANLTLYYQSICIFDDEAKAQKFEFCEMHAFHLKIHGFHFEMHKTADFHSNLLASWELVTESYQWRPLKYTHFTHFNEIERP